jgi:membrane-bound serine protease (ClpP class)
MTVRPVTIAVLLSFALSGASHAQVEPTSAPSTVPSSTSAAVVVIDGEINDFTQTMLEKRLDSARDAGARTVILSINTWGGAALAAIEISQLIKRQDDLHVIAFVDRKAISAGAMIALACDEIVMQPGSMLGDCAPIIPGQQLEKTERAKSEGPILAEFADSAARNGHDALLVQAMVSVGRIVHFIQSPDGDRRFVDADGYDQLVKNGDWKPVEGVNNPVDDGESLLTVTADQALKLGLSKATVATPAALAEARGLSIVRIFEHSAGERLISFLSSSAVRGVLSVIFLLSLYASFSHPGHGAPEAICLSSLGLLVGMPLLTGYATWVEIVLVVIGIGLLALELFVIPGFGFVGITGIMMLLSGLVLTFVPTEPNLPGWLPSLSGTWTALWRGIIVLTIAMVASMGLGMWLNKYLPSVPYFNRLVLTATVGGGEDEGSYATLIDQPVWPEIGALGRAITDLRPGGRAAFADPVTQSLQTTAVVSDSGFVAANTQVVVYEVHGNRVVVRPTETS